MPAKRTSVKTTSKHVGPGQAASKGRSAAAKAKVAANRAAVAAQNARAAEPTRVELVKQAQQLGVKGASALRKDALVAAIAKATKPATTKPAATAPAYRPTQAREQFKALQAWEQAGRKGPRPDTTDYDACQADHEARARGEQPRSAKKAQATGTRGRLGERGRLGAEARKAAGGKRHGGRRLTDDELTAYVAKVRADHPASSAMDELWFAHWCANLVVSKERFVAAFEAAGKAAKAA